MKNTNTGGPAFPQVDYKQPLEGGAHIMTIHGGMTLRDYFAAQALQGFIGTTYEEDQSFEQVAESCYRYADAMLKARQA